MSPSHVAVVEALEVELGVSPDARSRATIFGSWPEVVEVLAFEGVDLHALAQAIERVALVRPSAEALGRLLPAFGWATVRRRRAIDKAQVRVLTRRKA